MHKISVRKKINSSRSKVHAALWDIRNWAQFWAPLHKVEVLYDDGAHQDFILFLEWQEQNTYVRTVRFLDDKGNIAFFSPVPPAPMIVHHGLWHLTADHSQCTELTAIRWFSLPLLESKTLEENQQHLKEFSDSFVSRLEHLLEHLGDLCEK